ncbi:MAG: hypothetical protein IMZ61_11635 [Planctomycetes bacterium]|nr:hypothetical protein [Planctomycetota bacterium]
MAKIPEYIATELPGGSAGGTFQPYKETPPLTPINIGAAETAAKVKFGETIENIGETMMKIKAYEDNHNEEIIAQKLLYDFELNEAKTLDSVKQENRGTKAMQPDFLKGVAEGVNARIDEAMGGVQLSPRNAEALRKSLQHIGFQNISHALQYQATQRHEVESEIIQNDLLKAEFNIKNGASWETEAARHLKVVTSVQPGNEQLGLLHAQMLQNAGLIASKQLEAERKTAQDEAAYAEVVAQFQLGTDKADLEGAIKYIRNPDNLKEISRPQRQALENYVLAQDANDTARIAKIKVENHKKALDTVGNLWIKGDVKTAMKLTMESPDIPGLQKEQIISEMKKPQPEGKSNSGVYLQGAEKMYDTTVPLEDKKAWLLSNRSSLTDTDFKHLSLLGMSQERSNDKTAIKSGIDTLKATLITPGFTSQTQKERLDKAIKLYESGVEQNKESLKTPDQIKTYANTILKMSEFMNINPVADMKADMQKIRGIGLTPPALIPVPASTIAAGTTATNPKTGQKVTWDGSQWK